MWRPNSRRWSGNLICNKSTGGEAEGFPFMHKEEIMIDNAYARGQKLLCGDYSQYTYWKVLFHQKADGFLYLEGRYHLFLLYISGPCWACGAAAVVETDYQNRTFEFVTFEGNTSSGNAGDRNGGCVARHTYKASFDAVGGTQKSMDSGAPCTVWIPAQ